MIIDFEEVKKIWSTNTRPVVLYINNPFCRGGNEEKNCNYCVHKGCVKRNSDDSVYDFYFKELPKRIKEYLPIINSQDIKLISFGGGTPNYLPVNELKKFFEELKEIIPNFLNYNKLIELHPAYINKELISLLKEYNFTTLIFCFQTFDKKMLDKQNRICYDFENIKECRLLAKKYNMSVGCDLITMWDNNLKEWGDILKNDLRKVRELDLDEITISPLYQSRYSEHYLESYEYINYYVNSILKGYSNPEATRYSEEIAAIRFFKKEMSEDWKYYINSLTDFSWQFDQGVSTLGIGNYNNGNKNVYSIIGPNYTIYERSEKDSFDIKFDLIKNYNFWDSARNIIDALEKEFEGIEIPVGTELLLKNICDARNDTYLWDECKQGNCVWNLNSDCLIPTMKSGKLIKNIFDNKNKNIDKNKIRNYNL